MDIPARNGPMPAGVTVQAPSEGSCAPEVSLTLVFSTSEPGEEPQAAWATNPATNRLDAVSLIMRTCKYRPQVLRIALPGSLHISDGHDGISGFETSFQSTCVKRPASTIGARNVFLACSMAASSTA